MKAQTTSEVCVVLASFCARTGLPVLLDQFFLEENPGGPDEGWTTWSKNQAQHAACVIIIGSDGYFAAYERECEPNKGLGVALETKVIEQEIYEAKGLIDRVRIAFLDDQRNHNVPILFRGHQQFRAV